MDFLVVEKKQCEDLRYFCVVFRLVVILGVYLIRV